jgi:hypothetical protein
VEAGRPNEELERDPQLRDALHDILRLDIATDYRERRPGLLELTAGRGFTRENVAGFQLALLYVAYRRTIGWDEVAALELWRGGVQIAEYNKDGLALAGERSQPQ